MSTKTFLTVVLSYNALVGADGGTVRWTYTVPAGRRSEVEYFHMAIMQFSSENIGQAYSVIRINATNIAVTFITGIVGGIDAITAAGRISLDSGQTLDYLTVNGVAASQSFRGFCVLREYQ